ncbi:MAG: DegT/DnrJ/EryC1/StrS family aminotransferase [Syntrophorhabdaceae bacterium]|nr:DegT/DnrJ/EryC1/StrS family aminotransferase [Syntrophorhabdaceae bacterium]
MIPISRPYTDQEELQEIEKVLKSGWLGLGSVVQEFEKEIEKYLGSGYVIAVNTGTSALHIALDAAGIGKGDEVIVPSLTFCAGIEAILATGATPVFCDIEVDTLNIDIDDVETKITSKTKAIMPVHYCGNPCEMDRLLKLGRQKNILIVEDAAHAFGSIYKGKKIGSFGDITCFSFDPIKNITCGEGGAVVVHNDDLADVIRKKRNLGIDREAWSRYHGKKPWYYEVTVMGYRYHMSNINAAIGLVQLKRLEQFIKRKREIVKRYNEAFSGIKGIALLKWNLNEIAPFSYMMRITNGKRDELIDYLGEHGIGSGVHYIPNHLQPLFKSDAQSLPITEYVWKEIITLPLFFEMKDEEADFVIDTILNFLK